MSASHSLLLVACLGSLVLYAGASRRRFVAPEGVPSRMKVIAVAFVLFGVTNLWMLFKTTPIGSVSLGAGLVLYLVAVCLFLAACRVNENRPLSVAFTTDRPDHLVTTGPYRYIRHPFYASYCLTWLAGAVAVPSILLFTMFIAMTALYTWAARFEEEKFLRSSLAPMYLQYRMTTGMFFPLLSMRRPPD
jgi:protein-S-isoprenylcysteine O-methyltransferase Ste14